MTNPRDTGRYDAFTDSYVDTNVRVDFAWGNIPMQPNDDRGEATLNPALDSHIIAVSQYEGFPAFTPGTPFDDTIPNVEVPDLTGLSDPTAAETALQNAGLILGDTNSSSDGATSENELNVKSQSIPAGTLVNAGTTVSIEVYHTVGIPVPNLAGLNWSLANAAITGAGFTVGDTSGTTTVGATPQNVNLVASQTPTAGTLAAPGSAVDYVLYNYVAPTTGPISGFNRTGPFSLNGNQSAMYVVGRTVKPAIGDYIMASGSSDASHNVLWLVSDVVDDNSYNTGGTAVKVTLNSGTISSNTSSGGTWTKQ